MILPDGNSDTTSKSWRQHASQVADWQNERLLNRADKMVVYRGDWVAVECDAAAMVKDNCRSLKPSVFYPYSKDGFCKWVCGDLDNHDGREDIAQRNLQTAQSIQGMAVELGIIVLIEDSDGRGGLHVWVFFSSPIRVDAAYRFIRWLFSNYPDDKVKGFDVEKNPKRRTASGDSNGVRGPGHHHKRSHLSRFYGDGEWIEGAEAIEFMLGTPTTDPSVLDFMADYDPDPPPPKRDLPRRPVSGGGGIVQQAERHIESFPWEDLLQHFGWHGTGGKFWTRPGKSHGTSATLDHGGNGLLHVFSNAAGLPENQSYGKWRFWLHSMNFNDSQQRDAAQRYLREVAQ